MGRYNYLVFFITVFFSCFVSASKMGFYDGFVNADNAKNKSFKVIFSNDFYHAGNIIFSVCSLSRDLRGISANLSLVDAAGQQILGGDLQLDSVGQIDNFTFSVNHERLDRVKLMYYSEDDKNNIHSNEIDLKSFVHSGEKVDYSYLVENHCGEMK